MSDQNPYDWRAHLRANPSHQIVRDLYAPAFCNQCDWADATARLTKRDPDDSTMQLSAEVVQLRLQLARARAAFIDADALRRINRVEGNFTAEQLARWQRRASDRFDKFVNDIHSPTEPRS